MFSIRKIIKEELLNESVKLPIEIGDTVYMGKFKNKKTIVKKIEWNEKGDLMINGKSALRVRIPKKVKKLKEGEGILDSTENDFEWANNLNPLQGLDEGEKYKVWFGKITDSKKSEIFERLSNVSDKFREAESWITLDHTIDRYDNNSEKDNGYSEVNSIFLEWNSDDSVWNIGFMGGFEPTNGITTLEVALEHSRNYFDNSSSTYLELPSDLFL